MPDEYPDPMEVRLLTDAAVLAGGMTAGSGEIGLTVPVLFLKINCCAPGRIPDEEAFDAPDETYKFMLAPEAAMLLVDQLTSGLNRLSSRLPP